MDLLNCWNAFSSTSIALNSYRVSFFGLFDFIEIWNSVNKKFKKKHAHETKQNRK